MEKNNIGYVMRCPNVFDDKYITSWKKLKDTTKRLNEFTDEEFFSL